MNENSQDEKLKEEAALEQIGSLIVGSIKEAFKGAFHQSALPPVGETPFESWRKRLSYGDRLPRGRFFVGKRAGVTATVLICDEGVASSKLL